MKKSRKSASGLGAVLSGSLLTLLALVFLLLHPADTGTGGPAGIGRVSMEQLESIAEARLQAFSAKELPEELPLLPEAAATGYSLSDEDLIAPAPRQEAYGAAAAADAAAAVILAASDDLNTEGMYFGSSTQLLEGSLVRWYSDPTILAVSWKELINETVYTFSEVIVAHPSQLRRFLSGGTFGSGQLAVTAEMSATVNAVVAASGDFYAYRGTVISVHNGKVMRANSGWLDVCMVDYDGDFHMLSRSELTAQTDLSGFIEDYTRENDIRFCLEFGPILYDDGPVDIAWDYPAGACGKGRARSAICQMGPCHYLVVDANTEGTHQHEPNIFEFAEVVGSTGCRSAFALDGGQTASVTMNNELVNLVSYGSPRPISDIIYFATALPSGE